MNKFGGPSTVKKPEHRITGQYHLLALGIQNYTHRTQLHCSLHDTDVLCELLKTKYQFKVNRLDENATPDNFYDALSTYTYDSRHENSLKEHDALIVWMSGHGDYDPKGSGQSYFIPKDGAKELAIGQSINYKTTKGFFDNIKARQILLISDSCFSGGVFKGKEQDNSAHPNSPENKELDDVVREGLTSGRMELVSDKPVQGHSPFAHALIDAVRRNKKRLFTSRQLEQRIKNYFRENTQYTEHSQLDHLRDCHEYGGNFIFRRGAETKNNQERAYVDQKSKIAAHEKSDVEVAVPIGFASLFEGYDKGIASHLLEKEQTWYSWAQHHAIQKPPQNAQYGFDEKRLYRQISDYPDPCIITGHGGVGKTRFALELGKIAHNNDWLVVRITPATRGEHFKALTEIQNKFHKNILIILDYVETLKDKFTFDELVAHVSFLNRNGQTCRLLSTCRKTFWDNPRTHSKKLVECEEISLSRRDSSEESIWLKNWQKGVYANITGQDYNELEKGKDYLAFYGTLEKFLGGEKRIDERRKISDRLIECLKETLEDIGRANDVTGDFLFELTKITMMYPWNSEVVKKLSTSENAIITAIEEIGFSSNHKGMKILGHDLGSGPIKLGDSHLG